jgi:DNA-binding transcriptional MerR regulator
MARAHLLPDKLFFRIGEVSEIVGVKPHVLRYWEEEFGILKPMKTRGAHRQYRRRDVELALMIRELIHEEGFTIAGARRRMREMGHLEVRAQASSRGGRELELRAELLGLRAELAGLLARVDALSSDLERPSAGVAEEAAVRSGEEAVVHRMPRAPGASSGGFE